MIFSQLMALFEKGNYRATTSWKPWSAAIMLFVILVLSSMIAVTVVDLVVPPPSPSLPVAPAPICVPAPNPATVPATGTCAPGANTGGQLYGPRSLAVVLFMQFAMIVLTWIAASAGTNGAREMLALGTPRSGPGSGLEQGLGPRTYIAAIIVMFLWLGAYNALVWLLANDQWQADLFKYQDVIFSSNWWIFALIVVIGAPLSEELLFRGFLLPAIGQSQLGYMGAAFISSIAWAALHWDYSISGLIEIFLIGLYFSGLLWITGSLWVGIVCHGAYNLILLLALRVFGADA